ncbi:Card1-like endonuclease domain-containing protein [Gallibacterium melopsittaci]|uniref:Card1-like endonuclease domain-containing protein n=1 Tax=Gallibacterium melopsittaci TaxID=516063 RepID=A0ABV6HV60_9PAST
MRFDIHFCLISAQAAANLLPVSNPEFQPKSAVFFVSNSMKKNAGFLKQVFKDKGINVTLVDLVDEFDFAKTTEQFINEVEKYENENIALNITGGTKLMSIAAVEAFNCLDKSIFYVDTEQNRILFLSRDEQKRWLPPLPLNTKIKLKEYLAAYGKNLIDNPSADVNKEWLSAFEPFLKNYKSNHNLIPLLNKFLSESNGYYYTLDKKDIRIKNLNAFLTDLDNRGIISFNGETINFKQRKNHEFLHGGWLENYVYTQLKEIKKIDEIVLNAEVANENYQLNKNEYVDENKGNKNEFDIVFLAKNKLHIIECKTQVMTKEGGVKSEDILYKLETLKDYGGLMTKKCLVSYCEIPTSVSNRAKALNIKIIQKDDIYRIKELIQAWI